jgi:hypothetical protein
MRRVWWLVLGLVCAAGVVAGVLWWTSRGGVPVAVPATAQPSIGSAVPADDLAVHGAEPGEQENIKDVTALLAGLPSAFAQGRSDDLIVGAGAEGVDVRVVFPVGAGVSVDPATWRRTGVVASVTTTVTSPDATTRQVAIVFRDGAGWKLSETYPAAGR